MSDLEIKDFQKKLRIPIGVDDYKVMIEGNYLHIDKTLLILNSQRCGHYDF